MGKIEKLTAIVQERHLKPGETIVASVLGQFEAKVMDTKVNKTGVLVVTSKNLVFFAKGWFSESAEVFPLSNISSFESGKTLMGPHFKFFASGNEVSLKWITEGDVVVFAEEVQSRIGKAAKAPSPGAIPEQLQKLADLARAGIITTQEFESKKADLLARM